ncbi:hypothetical protein C8F04DRAFT_689621 [Mycena alexandri]|uniref:Transcription factor CBF/NF-Y/archaeal histone domain-containing protein n=1 Tax=Mycena alexandri TaxID=1745969 RepID=A0AAD6THP1_9AGAR|nr:hypothetical protein C8F04DRAFT_689621 [Mycena alexandri]
MESDSVTPSVAPSAAPSVAPSVASETPQPFELEVEEEDWDELNSDLDEDPVSRIPGETLLPALRIETIIKADGVMGALALSKEGLFILSVATEEFIKRLTQGGQRQAGVEGRTSVNYRDMAATTQQYQEFMFLQETIPSPVSLSEALRLRELKEKETLENDPALAAPTTYSSTAGYTPSTSKPKPKKAPNGKDKQNRNGSNSSSAHGQVRWDYEGNAASNGTPTTSTSTRGVRESGWTRWPNGQNFTVDPLSVPPPQNGLASQAQQRPAPAANGHAAAAAAAVPPRPRDADTSPPRQHPNFWQRSASPWSSGLLDSSASRQSTSNGLTTTAAQPQPSASSSSVRPPSPEITIIGESSTPVDHPVSTGLVSAHPVPTTGAPSASRLLGGNPGRTIYSQTKPPQ